MIQILAGLATMVVSEAATLAHIEPLLRGGLATLEPVEAHFYRSH